VKQGALALALLAAGLPAVTTSPSGTGAPAERGSASPAAVEGTRRLSPEGLEAVLDPYFRRASEERHYSGVVMVAQDGKPLFRKAYGFSNWVEKVPMRTSDALMLFSMTKQFTAAAILLLQDRGRLSIEDPVSRYVEGTPPEWAGVTIHHLLCHRSGIDYDNLAYWIENRYPALRMHAEPVGPFERQPLMAPPGSKYQYSNAGYILLSLVVASASGQSYQDYLRASIFGPLGMTATDCDSDKEEKRPPGLARGHTIEDGRVVIAEQKTHYIPGAGDVYSTVDDMLRWDEALYGNRLLSARALEAMFTPCPRGARKGYACGWVVNPSEADGRLLYKHGGGGDGFTGVVFRRPEEHVYIALLFNMEMVPWPFQLGALKRVDAMLYGAEPE
jgi:D-alanyl-D-alanine carboxypeptidase